MSDEIRYLGDVQRLVLHEGDVVVLSVKMNLPASEKTRIMDYMKAMFPNNNVVIIPDSYEISVVGGENE